MNTKTKQLTIAAMMLAICIVSQFFKNTSVYFTGSIVNAALIITALSCGLGYGLILAIITPITAFLITGAPIIAACPLIMPCIMLGNAVIVFFAWVVRGQKSPVALPISLAIGSVAKAAVMALTILAVVIPVFGTNLKEPQIAAARTVYSVTQLITALIGSVLAYIIWYALRKALQNDPELR